MSASPALTASAPIVPSSDPVAAGSACAVKEAAATEAFQSASAGRRARSRERILDLAERFGVDVMQDAEIVHLQLDGDDRIESFELAERLIERFGGLAGVLSADRVELRRYVGEATILNFKILREAAGRVSLAAMAARPVMSSFGAVADFFRAKLRGLPREEFWVAFLDKKNQLILVEAMGVGTVDHAPVYPREVLRRALEVGATALVLAHNHPSGDPEPSRPDIGMTKVIVEAGKVLGVLVHDHLIVGSQKIESFRALGLL
ncbi:MULTISPECIES: RadC family protein [unclassified Caulobacter]|uniref:JAB domain-containing protein n=1 Tax=unclassified Caulobacter TaxID=2648921 RepID=UPI0009E71E0B|nr:MULTISPECIES: DNA repair protein RadC [unclassified Caulobacter]